MWQKNRSNNIRYTNPKKFFKENEKLITPLPNKQNLQINKEDELILIINKEHYVYKENTVFKKLKLSKNCIFSDDCEFMYNNRTLIQEISDDTLIIKNAHNESLNQTCVERNIMLKNNYKKGIAKLKYHKNITYGISATVIIITLISITIVILILRK